MLAVSLAGRDGVGCPDSSHPRGRFRGPPSHDRNQRRRQRTRRSAVAGAPAVVLQPIGHRRIDRHYVRLAENRHPSRDDAGFDSRLWPAPAQSPPPRRRLAYAGQLDSNVFTGQSAYGMAATGSNHNSEGPRRLFEPPSATTAVLCGSPSGAASTPSRRLSWNCAPASRPR